MMAKLNAFWSNGTRATARALWLQHRETVQTTVLVLPPEVEKAAQKGTRKHKTGSLQGQFLSGPKLHTKASKAKSKKQSR
ncbi:TPA: hypothetical protein N0F65_005680 [Lagenidium giganteum]|uniref:Uncharacterized protein n=1 Tax=Lagenidium giganteum TaxID=4803 RepID=A0AAV2ZCS8_9STRA|nr:TPA: hypothetical protein N0F65_005680 [Lagenidium giganteum]